MYVVPEDLRQDVENYNDKIEKERRLNNPAVLYRYSRRKVTNNKQIATITKICFVIGIGFIMLFALCTMSKNDDKQEQTAQQNRYNMPTMQQYRVQNTTPASMTGQTIYQTNPIAYQYGTKYVQVPVYDQNSNQTYLIWQPVQNYTYR